MSLILLTPTAVTHYERYADFEVIPDSEYGPADRKLTMALEISSTMR